MTREAYDELKKTVKINKAMKELNQLKARAYDIIAALEQLQRELQAVNAEIGKKTQEQKTDEPGNDRPNY